MYTAEDYEKAFGKTKARVILGSALIVLGLAGIVTLTLLKQKIALYIFTAIMYLVCFFVWSYKIAPWLKYRKFLKELRTGQRKHAVLIYRGIAFETRMYDGVEVWDLDFYEEDGQTERLMVLDAEYPKPALEEGQKVRVESYGSFITKLDLEDKNA
ncbi:MAG: hypothetical protein IKT23_03535 [Clostridia bacterium]|nr:hypothetical protein [Clostridia bacterium]MBR6009551.1 hypothetical protein [Clostridia bacterium]MBR6498741.1 hypothetical protein [Clostridia bacterium]